jgi:hypothetical protein
VQEIPLGIEARIQVVPQRSLFLPQEVGKAPGIPVGDHDEILPEATKSASNVVAKPTSGRAV